MVKTALKFILPIVVLAVSVAAGSKVLDMKTDPEPRDETRIHPPVRVTVARPTSVRMDVEAHGRVRPRTEITIVPQVSGRVEYVAPELRDGGFFAEKTLLVRVEQQDYLLAVTQAEATVAQARAKLDRESAEADVARREWEKYGKGQPNDLVLRKPQLAEAKAMLASANALLAAARLAFDRTEIHALFAGRVRTENVDVGQFLTVGAPLAHVFATGFAEIRLAVPVDQLAFLDLPLRANAPAPRASAEAAPAEMVTLRADFGGREIVRTGVVVRTEAEIDARSRVILLRVSVEDPYGLKDPSLDPLLVGMFVRATLPGHTVDGVFVLGADAMRDGNRVAVVDEENRLRFREVTILRRTGKTLVISDGLTDGDQVCITRMETAVEGMRVRVVEEKDS